MIRAVFLALGAFVIALGLQAFVVDEVELRWTRQQQPTFPQSSAFSQFRTQSPPATEPIRWSPPDWMPWTLVASGAVTILYAFALPKRLATLSAGS